MRLPWRGGILRASRYRFQAGALTDAVKAMLDVQSEAGIPPELVAYLESVEALYNLAPEARRLRESILKRLRPRSEQVLKTLLVLGNELFAHEEPFQLGTLFAAYPREAVTEAISMLIDMLKREFGLSLRTLNNVDETALSENNVYGKILLDSIRILEFREAETLIDGLPYKAKLVGNGIFISSIDPDFEKSVRLGYIQTEFQRLVRIASLVEMKGDGGPVALRDLVKRGFDAGLGDFVQIVERPLRRLVFRMPAAPEFFAFLFDGNSVFEEEVAAALMLDVDSYGKEADEIIAVTSTISSLDVFKIQRLFRFVSYVYQKKLEDITDRTERNLLTLRSVIPVLQHDQLLSLIRMVLPQQAEEAMRLHCCPVNLQTNSIGYFL